MQLLLYVLANLMLVALGLYLTGSTWALAFTERIGQKLWRRIQPLTRRFLPARSVAQALPLGMPCGAACPAAWFIVCWRRPWFRAARCAVRR